MNIDEVRKLRQAIFDDWISLADKFMIVNKLEPPTFYYTMFECITKAVYDSAPSEEEANAIIIQGLKAGKKWYLNSTADIDYIKEEINSIGEK
jgi:hypothetical protein